MMRIFNKILSRRTSKRKHKNKSSRIKKLILIKSQLKIILRKRLIFSITST